MEKFQFVIDAALKLAEEAAKLTATPWDDRVVYALRIIYEQSLKPVSQRDRVALAKAEATLLELPEAVKQLLELVKLVLNFLLSQTPPPAGGNVAVKAAPPATPAVAGDEKKKATGDCHEDGYCGPTSDDLIHEALRRSIETTRMLVEAHAQLHYEKHCCA